MVSEIVVNRVTVKKPRRHTAVNDAVNVVEIGETFEYCMRNLGDDLEVDRADAFIDPIKGTFIHKLHADANVWIRQESAVERDDVIRVTVMHDMKLAKDLLAH